MTGGVMITHASGSTFVTVLAVPDDPLEPLKVTLLADVGPVYDWTGGRETADLQKRRAAAVEMARSLADTLGWPLRVKDDGSNGRYPADDAEVAS